MLFLGSIRSQNGDDDGEKRSKCNANYYEKRENQHSILYERPLKGNLL
jgi:hypothetical protein